MKKVEKVVYSLVLSCSGLSVALVALVMKYLEVDVWFLVGIGLLAFVTGYVVCEKIWGQGKLELVEDPSLQDTEKLNQEIKK